MRGLTVHVYTCAYVCWGSSRTGQVEIVLCVYAGRREHTLRQDRANSGLIKLTGVMNTEGRFHSDCAERALTAHTLSGFFSGTQATAQSSALNITNGNRVGGMGFLFV